MTTMTARAWGQHSGSSGSIGSKSATETFDSTGDTPDAILLRFVDWGAGATSGYSWTAPFGSGSSGAWSEMTGPAIATDEAEISWSDNTTGNTPYGFGLIHAQNVPWSSYPPDTIDNVSGVITIPTGQEGIIIAQSLSVDEAADATSLGWTTFVSKKSTGIYEMDKAIQFKVVGPGSYSHPHTDNLGAYVGETVVVPDTVGQGVLGVQALTQATPAFVISSLSGRTLS